MTDIEKRLTALETELAATQHEVERLKIIEECQHLMGRYMALHTAEGQKLTVDLYARRPDTSHESHSGYYVGFEAVKHYLDPQPGDPSYFMAAAPKEGAFFEHDLCTPTIAVADDLQTARGVWFSPGAESHPGMGKDGKPEAQWCWSKYAVDFIQEDGQWKLWHTHFYTTFKTHFDIPWTEEDPAYRGGSGHDAPGAAMNVYDPNKVFKAIPEAPMPYKTFTADMMRP